MPDAVTPPGCQGLIAAWRLAADAATPLDEAAVERALAAGESGLWLHFNLVDARARAFLLALPGLHPAARAALVDVAQDVRLDEEEDALFGALPDLHYDQEEGTGAEAGLLNFALSATLLVTARRHPLRGVHEAAQAGRGASAPEAFAMLLHATMTELGRLLANLNVRLGRIEDAMARGAAARHRSDLAALRRIALRLTRHFGPLREVATALREEAPPWADIPLLRREARQVLGLLRTLDAFAERARLAQDALDSAAAEETNRRLFVLSAISAAMLPATLVAGIFGMNVEGVPGVAGEAGVGWGFAMAIGLIAASIAATLAGLRLFRML